MIKDHKSLKGNMKFTVNDVETKGQPFRNNMIRFVPHTVYEVKLQMDQKTKYKT